MSVKKKNCVVKSTEGALYKRNREHVRRTEVEVTIREDSPSRYEYSAMNEDNAPPMIPLYSQDLSPHHSASNTSLCQTHRETIREVITIPRQQADAIGIEEIRNI